MATYRVREDRALLKKRAESIAIGLTVGSWTEMAVTRRAEVKRHAGIVADIRVVEDGAKNEVIAELSIGYPAANLTATAAALLTTVFGKLSMDGEIRLVDLTLPIAWARQFGGPRFGITGLRERTGVRERPLLMSIFKACVGLDLAELTAAYRDQALSGADLIKDDEIFFSEEYATPEQRAAAYAEAGRQVYETTGHHARYAVNLTGPVGALRERARRLREAGADALLFNVYAYGLDVLNELAQDPDVALPILAHPAVAGALYGSATHGIAASLLLGQLVRLCGADVAIYPSPYGSVTLDKPEGERLRRYLSVDNGLKRVMPAPSAGIHPGLVPQIVSDAGLDVILNAGGGIHGHPSGPIAGGQAFRAAIAAVMEGEDLAVACQRSEPLSQALDHWGKT